MNSDPIQGDPVPIERLRHSRSRAIRVSLALGMALFVAGGIVWLRTANAQQRTAAAGAAVNTVVNDGLQRSLRLDATHDEGRKLAVMLDRGRPGAN